MLVPRTCEAGRKLVGATCVSRPVQPRAGGQRLAMFLTYAVTASALIRAAIAGWLRILSR